MIYQIHNLSFSYANSRRKVLHDVSLTVEQGDVISVLGRNGAGKSTLLHCLLGQLKAQSGQVLLTGEDIHSLSARQIAATVGFVPQNHTPSFAYSVLDFVVMGCASQINLFAKPGPREYEAARQALAELGIAHLTEQPYTEISGGERQQATIARAIVSKPQAILFDEPTAHLDYSNQLRVLRIIKKLSARGYAVLITTHNPDHALLLDGKAALFDDQGNLTSGPAEQVVTQENLCRVYGTDVRLEYISSLGRMACLYPNI